MALELSLTRFEPEFLNRFLVHEIPNLLISLNKFTSSNPNTKIGEELYMLLLQEFQKEKFEKEKADNVVIEHAVP